MIEITKKARFITDYYGGEPAAGTLGTVLSWIDDKQSKALLSWADQTKKKGEEADQALIRILSRIRRDKNGHPIIGNWMLKRCFIVTGSALFNAKKNKDHPTRLVIKNAILTVQPIPHISVNNGTGKAIKKPDGIETYAVKPEGKSPFFKAYEYIKAGAEFEFIASFDDNLMAEEHIDMIIRSAGRFGVGSFPERFGKFEYVD